MNVEDESSIRRVMSIEKEAESEGETRRNMTVKSGHYLLCKHSFQKIDTNSQSIISKSP